MFMAQKTIRAALCALLAAGWALAAAPAGEEEAAVIDEMDAVKHNRPPVDGKTKAPQGSSELVEGKFGKAVKFTFADNARSPLFPAWYNPTSNWDDYAGISFWAKGDGSNAFSGIQLIDGDDYALRYGFCFPTSSAEWQKVVVPWCDFAPETAKADLLDPKSGFKPSKIRNIWFGKWWGWGAYPGHSVTIDRLALEKKIEVDATDYTPKEGGIPRALAKLKAKEPVTIVLLGDSLTDIRHWANRETNWPALFLDAAKKEFGCEGITIRNQAIGGTGLNQCLVTLPRDVAPHSPDLVAILFGYNDWDNGMRKAQFRKVLACAVDRVRRMTKGKADIMLMTTCPAVARWEDMKELGEAVREVASEKKTGLVDTEAAFHKAGAQDKEKLYCKDKTHLGPEGHKVLAETVLQAVKAGAVPATK